MKPRLRALIEAHARLTGSPRARHILDTWAEQVGHFVKVMPLDYKRALAELAAASGSGFGGTSPASEGGQAESARAAVAAVAV